MQRQPFRAAFQAVFKFCGIIACAGFGALTVIVTADILFRNLAIAKWPWLNEITEYLLTISTFFGAPWLLREYGHVNVDVVLRLVPRAAAQVLGRLANLFGLMICGLLFYEASRVIVDTRGAGSLVFKNLIFPEWYLQIPIVVCFGLCTLEFLGRVIERRTEA
ncbi:hypothetical protein MesoLjLb_55550 [Mesorhizobium sp. L-8-3]|nr:hypothetical protein MesoLjLb_55550 [Mesorhizobium sp. L-8-3]